jgi:hypothetical protein
MNRFALFRFLLLCWSLQGQPITCMEEEHASLWTEENLKMWACQAKNQGRKSDRWGACRLFLFEFISWSICWLLLDSKNTVL